MDPVTALLLEKADTLPKRVEAVRHGVDLGVPLHEMEEQLDYLDYLENAKGWDNRKSGRLPMQVMSA